MTHKPAKGEVPPRRTIPVEKRRIMAVPAYICHKGAQGNDYVDLYISIQEHTAELARVRREAFDSLYAEWREKNPDFSPENRYDDFFKDAFYLGYGRGREDAAKAAIATTTKEQK